jgi:nucleotide-binding universal stress UspA family protein
MLPITHILAPTDFSPRSYPALDVATELAEHFSARLIVAHVLTPIPAAFPTAPAEIPVNVGRYRDALLEDSRIALRTLVHDRLPAHLQVEQEVAWGPTAETIVELAEERGVDLIILCTRGATGLSRFVSGSVTEKVVRLSDVPVLTIQAADGD